MKLIYSTVILLLVFFCQDAYAQFGAARAYANFYSRANRKIYKRYYLGGGTCRMNVQIKQRYYDHSTDRVYKRTVPSTGSYTVTEGTFLPIIRNRVDAAFGLDVATTVNLYNYEVGEVVYTHESRLTETGLSYQVMMPIAMAYKTGGEISLNKKHKLLFAAGVGVAPGYSISKIFDADLQFSARKFIMMEMGVFAGIGWKLRANVFFGDMMLVNTAESSSLDVTTTELHPTAYIDNTVIGKTGINLSLLMMPYSWNWAKKSSFGF